MPLSAHYNYFYREVGIIWNFVKENWVAVAIVLVVISVGNMIYEKLSDVWSDKVKTSREKSEQIKKYGSVENYEKFVKLRERVCSANSQNEILVYGLGGRSNIKSVEVVDKRYLGFNLLVKVKDALSVRCDIIDFLCKISAFEFGIIELSGIEETKDFRDGFVSFLETDAANVQSLRGL